MKGGGVVRAGWAGIGATHPGPRWNPRGTWVCGLFGPGLGRVGRDNPTFL